MGITWHRRKLSHRKLQLATSKSQPSHNNGSKPSLPADAITIRSRQRKMSRMSGTREHLIIAFTKERQHLQQPLEIEREKAQKERDSEKVEFYLSEIESLDAEMKTLITRT